VVGAYRSRSVFNRCPTSKLDSVLATFKLQGWGVGVWALLILAFDAGIEIGLVYSLEFGRPLFNRVSLGY
jgi:hypothetical protein